MRHLPFKSALAPLLALTLSACATLGRGAGLEPQTPLALTLDSLFADTAFAHAHWGVVVRDLETGRDLYQHNAERLFVPASNMKLITGATVLEGLGPDYRYRTEFAAAGPVQNGVLRGALVVRGVGDPTLSARFLPDPRHAFRAWADSLRARGVRRVAGPLIGVDSAFADPHLGRGWAWDDLESYYAAEFGALQFNEGAVEVQVVPSRAVGQPAVIMLDPSTQYVPIQNETVTTPAGTRAQLSVQRERVGPGIVVRGQVPADTSLLREDVAVRDPTLFFLSALREALREAGIGVEGPALDADELPLDDLSVRRAAPLFVHHSPPLREILPGMMQPSQNWIAETLLRTAGLQVRGAGTARAGAAVADSLFVLWGLDTGELRVADGSGLSRYNLVSPDLLADLLAHMSRSTHRDLWEASLPAAGVSGTLQRRMRETPLAGNVRAKTGTLSGVRSLSGYLTTAAGRRVVFSIMVNNHVRSAADADRVIDAALLRIYQMDREQGTGNR